MSVRNNILHGNTSVSAILDITYQENKELQKRMLKQCLSMTDIELLLLESVINSAMENGKMPKKKCLKQLFCKKDIPLLLEFFFENKTKDG